MKRIFSKKSGFTLVEIVVAFAVFAIMAAAIMQILNLVSYERSENAEFMASLEEQERLLAINEKKDFQKKVGEVVLNFDGKEPTKIDYDMKAANGAEDGVGGGLTYFVSQKSNVAVEPGGSGGSGGSGGKGGSQGQLSNIDARITGSTKFDYIKILDVKKASDYSGEGVCYYLNIEALGLTMTENESMYAQFKLNFFSTEKASDTEQNVDASNKTYTRVEYLPATIIDAGYINTPNTWGSHVSVVKERHTSSGDSGNPLQLTKTGTNTLRLGAPYSTSSTNKFDFSETQTAKIYVVFDKDPNLSVSSFGANGVGVSDGTIFKHFPIYNEVYDSNGKFQYTSKTDKTSNYIYGAKMYDRKYD